MKKSNIWVVRPGEVGSALRLFLGQGVIALRDDRMGDLQLLTKNREAFKEAFRQEHGESTSRAVGGIAGKYFRFAHEMESGEYVLAPSMAERLVHVGLITGPYHFVTKNSNGFPHRRRVKWLLKVALNMLSQEAKYELGAARTVFSIKTHKDEFLKVIELSETVDVKEKANE